jgi:hypothetical protein
VDVIQIRLIELINVHGLALRFRDSVLNH